MMIVFIILAVTLVCFLIYYHKVNWIKIKRILPSALFLVMTYAVFAPSSLVLENLYEFNVHYTTIASIVFIPAIAICMCIILTGYVISERYLIYYISLIFGIATSIYIQMNFLNPKFPLLDGTEIDWSSYSTETIISTLFWILCILIPCVISFRWRHKAERVMKYIAYFASAVQVASLILLLVLNNADKIEKYGFTKEGEFSVGSEENIVIFVVDSLQSSALEEYLTSISDTERLNDFTFFDNAVSGGAPTLLALPVLLTGIEYEPEQDMEAYIDEIWKETRLFDDMTDNGYDIRFYATYSSLWKGCSVISNYTDTEGNRIDDYAEFGRQLYKLVNLYTMPQFLKSKYWLSTDAITDLIVNDEYSSENGEFYRDMQEAETLTIDFDKAFRLYHLDGVHRPFKTNENLEDVEWDSVSEQQQLQGVMKEIYLYIDKMKEIGIYEPSTILILGDHGRHEVNNAEINPAVLIKLPYEFHKLEHNSSPVHFRNIVATMAAVATEDYSAYGPSLYDITKDSDVERLHTIMGVVGQRIGLSGTNYYRLIVPEDARTGEYEMWNPHEINRISYKTGDMIDFTNQNAYTYKLDYRLYKENGATVASNELSICFELEDYQGDDLEFCFTCSDVYNHSQKIIFYANSKYLGNTVCTQDSVGKENIVTIPKESVSDKEVVIRMVFPGAVTPNQLDRSNPDTRVLSVAFDTMQLRGAGF